VSNRYDSLAALPEGAVVGTSSLRREAQLRERIRRLHRALARQRAHAAAQARRRSLRRDHPRGAGLKRLGLGTRIRALLDPDDSLPAPGQGALAIECRGDRRT
jgi:hydroxymethylbilane synthase